MECLDCFNRELDVHGRCGRCGSDAIDARVGENGDRYASVGENGDRYASKEREARKSRGNFWG